MRPAARRETVDTVVVGAGFAGMYMLHKLRQLNLRTRVIEAGSDVGGTWYWNRYPGARCDATSQLYSYSFSEELDQAWNWSEKYATQPEILSYAQHVAERFELRRDIWFDTRVVGAHFVEEANEWHVTTDAGDEVRARFVVMATGCLSVGRVPDLPGLAETRLPVFHTGAWPQEGVDFSGQRVAVIGTGSSGIQLIPEIARQAAQLTVFQRTPNFSVPAKNAPLSKQEIAEVKRHYPQLRKEWRVGSLVGAGEPLKPGSRFRRDMSALAAADEEREQEYQSRWESGGAFFTGAFGDLLTDEKANETAADFVRRKIKEIVADPETAEALTPKGYPIGAKRICVDTGYFETFNRPNVALVDLRSEPIERVTQQGLATAKREFEFDALVFATGFDAMTGALLAMDIRGRGGLKLAEKWREGPKAYLGLSVYGFPNLFLITGPGSPSVLGNVINHIEQHVEFVADLLSDTRAKRLDLIEAEAEAEERWAAKVNELAHGTLFPKANSWYLGANIPGKPRIFMPFVGGIGMFREICECVSDNGFEGFDRSSRRDAMPSFDGAEGGAEEMAEEAPSGPP